MKNVRKSLVLLIVMVLAFACETTQAPDSSLAVQAAEVTAHLEAEPEAVALSGDSPEAFRSRITHTFSMLSRQDEVWNALSPLIDLSAISPNGSIVVGGLTIRDDILMTYHQLAPLEISGESFEQLLAQTHLSFYPEDDSRMAEITTYVPFLAFSFPLEAFTSYDEWSNAGYPVISQSFATESEVLTAIDEEQAALLVGTENMEQLDSGYPAEGTYWLYDKEGVSAVVKLAFPSGFVAKGSMLVVGEEWATSFKLEVQSSGKVELSYESEMESGASPLVPMAYTPYIDIPVGCEWPLCSVAMGPDKHAEWLTWANTYCRDYETCIACCESASAPGPSYYMIRVRPTHRRCFRQVAQISKEVLSLGIGNGYIALP